MCGGLRALVCYCSVVISLLEPDEAPSQPEAAKPADVQVERRSCLNEPSQPEESGHTNGG